MNCYAKWAIGYANELINMHKIWYCDTCFWATRNPDSEMPSCTILGGFVRPNDLLYDHTTRYDIVRRTVKNGFTLRSNLISEFYMASKDRVGKIKHDSKKHRSQVSFAKKKQPVTSIWSEISWEIWWHSWDCKDWR